MRPSGRIFLSVAAGKGSPSQPGREVCRGREGKFVAARMEGLVRSGGAAYSKGAWVEADGRRLTAGGRWKVEAEGRKEGRRRVEADGRGLRTNSCP